MHIARPPGPQSASRSCLAEQFASRIGFLAHFCGAAARSTRVGSGSSRGPGVQGPIGVRTRKNRAAGDTGGAPRLNGTLARAPPAPAGLISREFRRLNYKAARAVGTGGVFWCGRADVAQGGSLLRVFGVGGWVAATHPPPRAAAAAALCVGDWGWRVAR